MKKDRKCELCGDAVPAKSRDSLMDLGWTFVADIRAPVRKMMYFCPKHTAEEITASIEAVIRPKCTRTDCENSPFECDLPDDKMKDECLQEVVEDEARTKWEDPGPEEDGAPECNPC